MQVYPAGYIVPYFRDYGKAYIVDKNPQQFGNMKLIAGNASEKLPELVRNLLDENYE